MSRRRSRRSRASRARRQASRILFGDQREEALYLVRVHPRGFLERPTDKLSHMLSFMRAWSASKRGLRPDVIHVNRLERRADRIRPERVHGRFPRIDGVKPKRGAHSPRKACEEKLPNDGGLAFIELRRHLRDREAALSVGGARGMRGGLAIARENGFKRRERTSALVDRAYQSQREKKSRRPRLSSPSGPVENGRNRPQAIPSPRVYRERPGR